MYITCGISYDGNYTYSCRLNDLLNNISSFADLYTRIQIHKYTL